MADPGASRNYTMRLIDSLPSLGDSGFYDRLREAWEKPEESPDFVVRTLGSMLWGKEKEYDPIGEILRPREPQERPDRMPIQSSPSPTIDEILSAADELYAKDADGPGLRKIVDKYGKESSQGVVPAFSMKGDKPANFSFESLMTGSKEPGFSPLERPIADLAREREAARRQLIELPMLERAAVMEMAGEDQTATLKEKRDVILEDAMRREEEAALNALVEQAQAALMQRSNGDVDFSTQQLNRLSALVDREIAEGKVPPVKRRERVKQLLLSLLQDPRMSNATK